MTTAAVATERPPLPPLTLESAPQRVALAYTEDSRWRNRAEVLSGRASIVAFLTRTW